VKINMALSRYEQNLGALMAAAPVTAVRHGLLGFVHDAVAESAPWMAEDLELAAVPLCAELDVPSLYDVPLAMHSKQGRPSNRVLTSVTTPEMVEALVVSLNQLGYSRARDLAIRWGPRSGALDAVVPLLTDDVAARRELVDALRLRAVEILDGWGAYGLHLAPEETFVDGRTMMVAARVWQVPTLTGSMGPIPVAAAALYPNRLGRSAGAVACSKINGALRTKVPPELVQEALALLVAIGESITTEEMSKSDMAAARKGSLPVRVRLGEPLSAMSTNVHSWWPVFSAWGSSERREKIQKSIIALPTAWKLSTAEADVLLWALTRVGAFLGVAASFAKHGVYVNEPDWGAHVESEFPTWDAGARSVWSLMQRGRRAPLRTDMPDGGLPRLDVASAWPWRAV
jgi:hypothetical protein